MARLDFFAVEGDQRALFEFLFYTTDVRVFESYSKPSQELREFRSVDELAIAFKIGLDEFGNGMAASVQLWSPSVMSDLTITQIALDPDFCDGHTFRYRIDGGGLMQLYLGGVHGKIITKSHFGHQSEARARAWGTNVGVNWESLKSLSNKIQYHVRKRMAVAIVASLPILPNAYELVRSSYALKEAAQTPWEYEFAAIKPLKPVTCNIRLENHDRRIQE
ncbi:MAG TPA: hypothetical protein VKX17_22895 [Planctomycetota bacterium]|nr:hypothetical protein [Planctomycetota bacterium]